MAEIILLVQKKKVTTTADGGYDITFSASEEQKNRADRACDMIDKCHGNPLCLTRLWLILLVRMLLMGLVSSCNNYTPWGCYLSSISPRSTPIINILIYPSVPLTTRRSFPSSTSWMTNTVLCTFAMILPSPVL